jgi:hypothetical protein
MATKKTTQPEATGTVEARRALERARQAEARAERDRLVKETKADLKATAERLEAKPTDSRKLVS